MDGAEIVLHLFGVLGEIILWFLKWGKAAALPYRIFGCHSGTFHFVGRLTQP
jgi:hypothetical protein